MERTEPMLPRESDDGRCKPGRFVRHNAEILQESEGGISLYERDLVAPDAIMQDAGDINRHRWADEHGPSGGGSIGKELLDTLGECLGQEQLDKQCRINHDGGAATCCPVPSQRRFSRSV